MKLKICFVIFFVVLFWQATFAKGIGTTMFQILQMPTNAYDAALAGTSSMGDNSSIGNPAIIPFSEKSLILSHAVYLQNTRYSIGAVNIPIKETYGFNVSFCYFDAGSIDRTIDYNGGYMDAGTFNAGDKYLNISYGTRFFQNCAAGIAVKYIKQDIDDVSYSGFAATLSGLYFITNEIYLNFGIDNFGPDVKGYSLPTNLYCNIVGPLSKDFVCTLQFDDFYNDDVIDCRIAAEKNFHDTFFLRFGYNAALNNDYNGTNNSFITNLTLGAGLKMNSFFIDYAWLPKGDLGSAHMFTLRVRI